MKKLSVALLIGAGCLALNVYASDAKEAAAPHAHGTHWAYEGEAGPEHWGDLSAEYALCKAGIKQSPVDLKDGIKAELASLAFSYQAVPLKVINNGHTIQVDESGGGTLAFGGQEYKLAQFHFHAPSEHMVAGSAYPMELHLVHKNDKGQLAVVGVFIKAGEENAALKAVFDNLPRQAGDASVQGATINAAQLLPAGRDYQHYIGSLTTPPCSEGVKWIVLKDAITMSQAQIDAFKKLFPMNARPVQPANDRFLLRTGSN